jgi:hypothetical protein
MTTSKLVDLGKVFEETLSFGPGPADNPTSILGPLAA